MKPGPIWKLQAPLLRLWSAEGANDGLRELLVLFVQHPWARKLPSSSSEHTQARLKRGFDLASLYALWSSSACEGCLMSSKALHSEVRSGETSQWGQIRRKCTDVFQWGSHSSRLALQRKTMSSPPTWDSHIGQRWLAALSPEYLHKENLWCLR